MSLSRAPSWHSPKHEDLDLDGVETVDLTLSPSPEPQPRRRPKQQHLSTYLKHESKQMAPVKADREPPGSSRQPAASDPSTSQINPDHLRQIVNTSSPTAIRTVLLNLCKLSPALSGAVARGLAPSSSFAQATIKEYQKVNQVSHAASDSSDLNSSSDQVKQPPSINKHIKREAGPIMIPSDSDDDDDLDTIPRRVPRLSRSPRPSATSLSSLAFRDRKGVSRRHSQFLSDRPGPSRPPLTHRSRSRSPTLSPDSFQSAAEMKQRFQIKNELKSKPKCVRCNRTMEKATPCVYHPGKETTIGRVAVYTCCREKLASSGCTTGSHIAGSVDNIDLNEYLRFDRASTPYSRGPKEPRHS